jgi:hypothetical protein
MDWVVYIKARISRGVMGAFYMAFVQVAWENYRYKSSEGG